MCLDLKTEMEAACLTSGGNWLHNLGAATANALSPFSFSRYWGTYKRALSADLRDLSVKCMNEE